MIGQHLNIMVTESIKMCNLFVILFLLLLFFTIFHFRSTLYKGVSSDLPDLSVLQVAEVYKDLTSTTAPLVTTMGMSSDVSVALWEFWVFPKSTIFILVIFFKNAHFMLLKMFK